MVTEQVKRIQVIVRELGFKRGEWSISAERKHRTDRSNGGRRYIEFGPAHATTSAPRSAPNYGEEHAAVVARAFGLRHELASRGLNVSIWEGEDESHISFITLSEARDGKGRVVRRAGYIGNYVEKPVAA